MDRQSGKVNAAVVIIIASLLAFAGLSMFTGERPMSVAAEFLDSLAKGDAEKLTDLSNTADIPREELLEQWERATKVAGPYFKFLYKIQSESFPTPTSAVVVVSFTPEAGSSVAYDRRLEIPLTKTDDGWKVDALALNRDIYPGLPR